MGAKQVRGWLKLERKILKWEWYSHPPTRGVFIHILLLANRVPTTYRGHEVPAYSTVIGRKQLAMDLGFTEQQIRTALSNLQSTNDITIKSTKAFSIVTVSEWEVYQGSNKKQPSKQPRSQPTDNQQITTEQETNKLRKDIPPSPRYSEKFEEFWSAWKPYDMPRGNKSPASKTFESLENQDQIIRSARRYIEDCHAKTCKTQHAQTWLNQRGWESWQEPEKQKINTDDWPDWKHKMAERIGVNPVQSWFDGCEVNGESITLKPFKAAHVRTNFMKDVEVVFGENFEVRAE